MVPWPVHWKEIQNKEAKQISFFSQAAYILGHFYGRDVFLQIGVKANLFSAEAENSNVTAGPGKDPLKAEI